MNADPESPPLPRRVQLEVTRSCNLRCPMCLVRYRPVPNRTGEDRAVLGDATAEGIATVWSGARYAAFRRALLSEHPPEVCARCSLYCRVF